MDLGIFVIAKCTSRLIGLDFLVEAQPLSMLRAKTFWPLSFSCPLVF